MQPHKPNPAAYLQPQRRGVAWQRTKSPSSSNNNSLASKKNNGNSPTKSNTNETKREDQTSPAVGSSGNATHAPPPDSDRGHAPQQTASSPTPPSTAEPWKPCATIGPAVVDDGLRGTVYNGCLFVLDGSEMKLLPLQSNPTGWLSLGNEKDSDVTISSTLRPRTHHIQTIVGNELVVFGGLCAESGKILDDAFALPLASKRQQQPAWRKLNVSGAISIAKAAVTPCPTPSSGSSTASLLVHGGLAVGEEVETEFNNVLYELHLDDGAEGGGYALTELSAIEGIPPLVGHQLVAQDGTEKLLIFGGRNAETGALNHNIFLVERTFYTAEVLSAEPPIGSTGGQEEEEYYYFFDAIDNVLWWIGGPGAEKRCFMEPFSEDGDVEWYEVDGDNTTAEKNTVVVPSRAASVQGVVNGGEALYIADGHQLLKFVPPEMVRPVATIEQPEQQREASPNNNDEVHGASSSNLEESDEGTASSPTAGTTTLPKLKGAQEPQTARQASRADSDGALAKGARQRRHQPDLSDPEQPRHSLSARGPFMTMNPIGKSASDGPIGGGAPQLPQLPPLQPLNNAGNPPVVAKPKSHFWEHHGVHEDGNRRLTLALMKHRRDIDGTGKTKKKRKKKKKQAEQEASDVATERQTNAEAEEGKKRGKKTKKMHGTTPMSPRSGASSRNGTPRLPQLRPKPPRKPEKLPPALAIAFRGVLQAQQQLQEAQQRPSRQATARTNSELHPSDDDGAAANDHDEDGGDAILKLMAQIQHEKELFSKKSSKKKAQSYQSAPQSTAGNVENADGGNNNEEPASAAADGSEPNHPSDGNTKDAEHQPPPHSAKVVVAAPPTKPRRDIDVSVLPCPTITSRDLYYIREGMATLPHIDTINISGKTLGFTETRMFVDIVAKFLQLVKVIDVDTVYHPPEAREEIEKSAEKNECQVREMEAKFAADRRARRLAAKQRKLHAHNALMKPLLKKRLFEEHLAIKDLFCVEHMAHRQFLLFNEKRERELLLFEMQEGSQAVNDYLASIVKLHKHLKEVEEQETLSREEVAKEFLVDNVVIFKEEREHRREAMMKARIRNREKKHQREVLEKEEKMARISLRQQLDQDGTQLLDWHKEEYTPLLAAHNAKLEAERREKERIRMEREAAEREELRRQARHEAMLAMHAKQRDTMVRDHSILHDRIFMEETKEYALFKEQMAVSRMESIRKQQARERAQMRVKCSEASSVISFGKWHTERSFCQGSSGPVPVIPETYPLHVKPMRPKYMKIMEDQAVDFAGSMEQSTTMGAKSSSSVVMSSTALLAEDESLIRLTPNEVTNEVWMQQKTMFLGAEATITLDQHAEGADGLVHDAFFQTRRADTNTCFDQQGNRLGTFEVVDEEKESGCCTSVRIATSYQNPRGASGFNELLHSVAFRRDVTCTDVSPCSGTLSIRIAHYKPRDGYSAKVEDYFMLEEPPSYMQLLIRCAEETVAQSMVVDGDDMELSTLKAARLVESVRVFEHRNVVLDTFPSAKLEDELPLVYSTFTSNFSFNINPRIIALSSPAKQNTEYEEGQGDGQLLRGMLSMDDVKLKNMNGFFMYVDLGPCVCNTDYIWTAEDNTAVVIRKNEVFIDDLVVAKVRTHGILFDHSLKSQDPTRIELELEDGVPPKLADTLVRAFVFRNDTRDPTDAKRTIRIGLYNPNTEIDSSSVLHVTFKLEDDLTVIDYGVCGSHVAYRFPAQINSALREVIRIPSCYFGQFCDVYDADTDEFDGGSLLLEVEEATPDDSLRLDPPHTSPIEITTDGDIVYGCMKVGKLIKHDEAKLEVKFDRGSIEILRELIHTFDYVCQAQASQIQFIKQPRVITTRFAMDGAGTVTSQCNVRISHPLIHVPSSLSKFQYRENAGLMRIGTGEVANDDDGWDGGYICFDMVSGWTEDDRLVLKEDDEFKLVDESKLTDPSSKKKSVKSPLVPLPPPTQSGKGDPSAKDAFSRSLLRAAASSTNSEGGAKNLFAQAVQDATGVGKGASPFGDAKQKIREMAKARREEMAARRKEVLEQARSMTARIALRRRRLSEPENAMTRSVMLQGRKIGTAIISHKVINVFFEDKLSGERVTDRGKEASIKKKDANAVLKRLHYINDSENPHDLHKVVSITASDGLPHGTISAVEIEVQADDDATELRRLSSAPKAFRSLSDVDVGGFCLFGDVKLNDPDTFFFNGGFVSVDLVGGGDAKTDQLGIMSVDQQRAKGIPDEDLIIVSEDQKTIFHGEGNAVGELILDAPNAEGHSNVAIKFAPPPAGHTRAQMPQTHEDADKAESYISLQQTQKILNRITYTSSGGKIKTGARVYQARVGFENAPESIGKLRLTVNVTGPLLWNPDFGCDVTFKEGKPPSVLLPKMVLNLTEKDPVRDGFLEVSISKGFEDTDVLDFEFKKSDFTYDKKSEKLEIGGQLVGKVSQETPPNTILVNFDFSSKMTNKQLQQLLKTFTYHSTSEDPGTHPRTVSVKMSCKAAGLCETNINLIVLSTDSPTEIILKTTTMEIVRNSGPVPFATTAKVVDPDTSEFGADCYIDVDVKGGTSTDIISSTLINENETTDLVIESAAENPVAKLVRKGSPSQLRLEVIKCTLDHLTAFVQSLTMELAPNQHDRSSKKGIVMEVKSGEAQPMKSNVSVDVVPQLIDLHQATANAPIKLNTTEEVEFYPTVVVANTHFVSGGSITIDVSPPQPWYVIKFSSKHQVTVGKKKEVLVEGRKAGTFQDEGNSRFVVTIPAKVSQAHAMVQKILRAIAIEAARLTDTQLNVVLTVKEEARSTERVVENVIDVSLP